jgi:hypothetical protein
MIGVEIGVEKLSAGERGLVESFHSQYGGCPGNSHDPFAALVRLHRKAAVDLNWESPMVEFDASAIYDTS